MLATRSLVCQLRGHLECYIENPDRGVCVRCGDKVCKKHSNHQADVGQYRQVMLFVQECTYCGKYLRENDFVSS